MRPLVGGLWVLLLLSPPRVEAATLITNDPADLPDAVPGDGICATAAGTCTLRAAVGEANALAGADTILVSPGFYLLEAGPLEITDPLELVGEDAQTTVIDGNRGQELGIYPIDPNNFWGTMPCMSHWNGAVIRIDFSDATIRRVTVQGGLGYYGGGILAKGSLEVEESVIRDNVGGGIALYPYDPETDSFRTDRMLTLRNSVVSNNYHCAAYDAGLYVDGTTFVIDSMIRDNLGVGIYNSNRVPKGVTLINSTVEGNVPDDATSPCCPRNARPGRGIDSVGPVHVENSVIRYNVAHGGGAGISSFPEDYRNPRASITVVNSQIHDNTATFGAGLASDGPIQVENSEIHNNRAVWAPGVAGGEAPVEVTRSRIHSNVAEWWGAIMTDGPVRITDSVIHSNSANACGGVAGSRVTVRGSTIRDNFVASHGGGVCGTEVILEGSTVSGNRAESPAHGGGFSGTGAGIEAYGAVYVTNSTVSGNHAGNYAGAISSYTGSVIVTNSTLSGNSAGGSGDPSRGSILEFRGLRLDHATVAENVGPLFEFNDPNSGAIPSRSVSHSILYGNSFGDCGSIFDDSRWEQTLTLESEGHNLFGDASDCILVGDVGTDLIGVDPLLGPLQNNGGPTATRALFEGSPAIDAAGLECLDTDQRGVPRPQGPACDIGAYEKIACNYDGVVDPSEQCDDGNTLGGDGCSPLCETELLSGRILSLSIDARGPSRSGVLVRSRDSRITLGWGDYSADDPVLHGGTVRIGTLKGDRFDRTHELRAENWRYIKGPGRHGGYRYRNSEGPIRSVVIRPGRSIKVRGRGSELGHTLGQDPNPVHAVVTIGSRMYRTSYGGTVRFRSGSVYRAEDAPPPEAAPLP